MTICKQICYNLDMPYDDIPHDLVPLKTYFKQVDSRPSNFNMIKVYL